MYVPIEIVFVFRHSATILSDQLVIFGGWDAPIPYNDLFILDMCKILMNNFITHYIYSHSGCELAQGIAHSRANAVRVIAGTIEWKQPEVAGAAPSPRRYSPSLSHLYLDGIHVRH